MDEHGVKPLMEKYPRIRRFDIITILIFFRNGRVDRQTNQPCVEIDGVMLADVSGEEVEEYLKSNNLVEQNDQKPSALSICLLR